MKLNSLRLLDYWIGRPICWLFTLAFKARKALLKRKPVESPGKILFIKLFGMGSIVLSFPALRAVRHRYPDCSIYYLTFKENEDVLAMSGLVPYENIVLVRRDGLANITTDIVHALFRLLRERIDVVVDLEFFCRFTAIMSFLIRSKDRIGFYGYHTEGLKRGGFINCPVSYNHTLHTSRVFFTLLKPLGFRQEDFDPLPLRIPPSEGFREKVLSLLVESGVDAETASTVRWVVLNPNSSELIYLRRWPQEHFAELTRTLFAQDESLGVIFIGAGGDRQYVEALVRSLPEGIDMGRVANLAGMTGIRDLLDVFYFAELFITNDSGPAHIASLTPVKNIVLFGPETPELYAPLGEEATCVYSGFDCQPCVTVYNGKHSYCTDNVCLRSITPGHVFSLAEKLLSSTGGQKL